MPEHRGKMINWNPLIVGKIIKYAQGNEAQKEFLADVENFDPVSVEAYALITEWISVTTGTLSRSEMMIFNTSEFWSEFEENYLSWDAHIRSQMLKVIKMIAIIDIDIVLENSLTSDELNVEIFEILVEGEAARVFPVHLPKIMEYMSSRKFLQMLLESDDCKFRFRILRSFAALTDLLPLNNPIIMRLMDFMECGCEAKILEILMFFMKKILILPPPKPIQENIFEVIKIGCESDDQTVRKNAFFVLQHFLQDFFFPVDSVTCYIAIVNAIAQNQSHLMCPAINMLPKVEGMELKWQILLLRCILRTQNRQIVCPTLKYITSREDFRDILQDILSLAFAALNQIQIHRGGEERDAAQRFCLKAFTLNWKTSIEHFATISWLPFPLYSILMYITDDIASFSSLSCEVEEREVIYRAFSNISSNINNLQTDHFTKKSILKVLLLFLRRIEKNITKLQKAVIVKAIVEVTTDDDILNLCRETLNDDGLIVLIPVLDTTQDFDCDVLALLKSSNELDEKDLLKFARKCPKEGLKIDEKKAKELLRGFQEFSIKEKLILLLILRSSHYFLFDDVFTSHFIRNNFKYTPKPSDVSDEFHSFYTEIFFKAMFHLYCWNFNAFAVSQILEYISNRLDYEQDYSRTFFLFTFLNNVTPTVEEKITIERLIKTSYRELMSLKGKSQFASVCGVFIEKFPSKWISIEETMRKLLVDTSLISHHITEAIGEKLTYFSNELLCELLCAREGAEVSFLQKNSPLRELQFKIVNYIVRCKEYQAVLDLLVDRYATLSRTKVMYYPNSHHHLAKLRIIQGIAAIARKNKVWHKEYLEFLLNEANQPSILYILELLVAETIPMEEIEELFRKLEDPKDLKMHSIQSIFCILFILCKRKQCRDFSTKTFRALHPWTMGQNFSCRLYAQIAMQKIFPFLEDVQEHEREMHRVVEFSFEHLSGNPEKNIERLIKDFRFNFLNIDHLLCDKYIFRDIPRITGVAESEIVHECSEGDESLANITHPWHEKNSPGAQTAVEMYDNIQTKIIPPDGFVGGTQGEGKQSNLVVCASLIENHPNLGGLARTCEIFGVQRLTLNSLRDIENSQFLALSMSAEKWLMLEEVKKWQIIAYCTEMKRQGYTIVGAEQTAKSVVLSEVAFPEKTLLVLGHEKEGLPADIISFLDIAVEIPQLGRLRSLNVHVTGSIFIYQYAMQHLLQGKN
ncbi:uncharacterized protein LOC129796385 [Lutzomyia longipalpis]|uniref:uncharacterized protein LOC129796385 n=1 Tax=Lutzomyia longipalpis TaxID=7200 RepID=UPI0024845F16|nr:uncharacterized protein LOC129796385 [Lutzomyia longipalpis]